MPDEDFQQADIERRRRVTDKLYHLKSSERKMDIS
jgi:hypothetical protein